MLLAATRLDALRSQRQGALLSSLQIVIHLMLTLLVGGFWLWISASQNSEGFDLNTLFLHDLFEAADSNTCDTA